MRVIVVVTSSRLFETGSDLRPIQIEGDCNCRLYYLRFRLSLNDVFDQLDRLMKPLHPRIFNLIPPAIFAKPSPKLSRIWRSSEPAQGKGRANVSSFGVPFERRRQTTR